MSGPDQRQAERGPAQSFEEDYVSSVSDAGGAPNRRPLALVLAVIGVLGIILGIVYLAVPAGNLPSILGHTTPANGHHSVRMAVSFVIGVACLVGAWFVNKGSKSQAATTAPAPAETSTRD
ncbi:MAG TPA: hypothetical protein VLW44_03680 [Streptosporangiaceae bacterium]|jgi:hypothetical protein|nr:hypothetical protein [Streptosporangiaceae bacterium]